MLTNEFKQQQQQQKQNYENGYIYFPQIKLLPLQEKRGTSIYVCFGSLVSGVGRLLIVADFNTIFLFLMWIKTLDSSSNNYYYSLLCS